MTLPADPPAECALTWERIGQARARIAAHVSVTPVLTSATLDAACGAHLYFKCENFQKGGAFKARGAMNAVLALPEEVARRGVVTHSSGNHGAALARAARVRGIPAWVVMPEGTARPKRAAVERLGATIAWCAPTLEARERAARDLVESTGATLVHPYDDLEVMAGQGTVAAEFLGQVPALDVLVCPVGGGGLLAGCAVAARHLKPGIRVVGAEPAGAADAARSLASGHIVPEPAPRTIADGLRATVGVRPFAEIARLVEDIVTVPEEAIVAATRTLWEVLKIVVEPSAAVAYAPLVAPRAGFAGVHAGIVLTGGNIDLDRLPWQ